MRKLAVSAVLVCCAVLVSPAASFAQSSRDGTTAQTQASKKPEKGAAAEVGSGAGPIAGGAAKGAGHAAEGVGKGVADIATLHPIDGAGAIGKGAAKAGKDVTVGTAKGVGKIGKGIGKAIGKIF